MAYFKPTPHYIALGFQARKLWPEIEARHGMFCHWCGVKLIRLHVAKQTKNMKYNFHTGEVLVFHADGSWEGRFYATIDHLLPARAGGESNIDNLVPSCKPCNVLREHGDPSHFIRRAECHYYRVKKEQRELRTAV